MIGYSDALQILLKHATPKQTEKLPLLSALGKVASAEVKSTMNVPSFRNSAMDGFAVRHSDIVSASAECPVTLSVLQTIAAGDIAEIKSEDGAVQIMTGAPVPELFDAVIPIEDVSVDGNSVTFSRPVKANENIRLPGDDVCTDQVVLRRGETITAERIMLLAALGAAEVETYKLPKIHILSTGKEITDNIATPLANGKIYNSNAPYLLARCAEEGFVAQYDGIVADDAVEFETRVQAIPEDSAIITTGAVSKGTWDFIPESLNRLGATTHFHRVNIRPGKPILFATLPNGSWFFGLPGNPISTAVGFRFFVLPLMQVLQGQPPEQPIIARLANPFTKKGNFRQFLKTTLEANPGGKLRAYISTGQESFKISPMAESTAWMMMEEIRTEYEIGELVSVFPFKEALLCKAA